MAQDLWLRNNAVPRLSSLPALQQLGTYSISGDGCARSKRPSSQPREATHSRVSKRCEALVPENLYRATLNIPRLFIHRKFIASMPQHPVTWPSHLPNVLVAWFFRQFCSD